MFTSIKSALAPFASNIVTGASYATGAVLAIGTIKALGNVLTSGTKKLDDKLQAYKAKKAVVEVPAQQTVS